MDDTTIRISCAQNGYVVEVDDPDIKKQNRKSDMSVEKDGKRIPWRDPRVKFTFKDTDEVATFIKNNIEKLFPDDDDASYSKAFDLASEKDE